MMQSTTSIRRNPRAEFRSLGEDEGGVLLHLDTAAYHGVNGVGAVVWTLLDGITFEQLLAELRRKLDDTPPALESEISVFLDQLAERDLVVLEDQEAPAPA
jgi:hypothetical protein